MKDETFKTDTNDPRKLRKDFKNVETKISSARIFDNRYRPEITSTESLKRLSDEIKSSPQAIVNFFVDIGLEVLERGTDGMKKELAKKIQKLLK